ncbi:hypothetical protein SteCoe_13409 [Stentor coeruleus]|uniref:Uncharacterized protein n=1 Tax=Stentor coeruleus TaxID=5963 RepID=A0A1R2C8H8_9CILI|nr:hypothetical protein SteCoe_13409 [Stentor coeruleus]
MLDDSEESSESDEETIKTPKGPYDYSSSEDEYYNRTKISICSNTPSDLDSLQQLLHKKEEIIQQITSLSIKSQDDADDPLDSFMNENNEELREENLKSLEEKLKEINKRIDSLQKACSISQSLNAVYIPDPSQIRSGNKKRKIKEPEDDDKNENKDEKDLNFDWVPPEDKTGSNCKSLNKNYGY